jgi:hypothetical protein
MNQEYYYNHKAELFVIQYSVVSDGSRNDKVTTTSIKVLLSAGTANTSQSKLIKIGSNGTDYSLRS